MPAVGIRVDGSGRVGNCRQGGGRRQTSGIGMNGQDQIVGRGTDFACAEFDHGEVHGSRRCETLTELGVGGGITEVDGAFLANSVANHT